jgi:hypothetical protein
MSRASVALAHAGRCSCRVTHDAHYYLWDTARILRTSGVA